MGMYDVINGEQIKFFSIPYISVPDLLIENSCLFWSGGRLIYFEEGSEVPWKTLWCNYGKNFNIIDFFPYDHEFPMIHLIRDGKNAGFVYFNKATNDIFDFDTYDDKNGKLNIKNIDELNDCLNKKKALQDAWDKIKREAWHNEVVYLREQAKNEETTEEVKAEMKRLRDLTKKENAENDAFLLSFKMAVAKFYIDDDETVAKYQYFGALVDGLYNCANRILSNKDLKFVVVDDRLTFIVAYNEMLEIFKSEEFFLENYCKALNLCDDLKDDFNEMFKFVLEAYQKIRDIKVTKDMIGDYLLGNLKKGRHKEYYSKYDVTPYEGFEWKE